MTAFPFRIGQGYDLHRLAEGRDLILGGVKIAYEKGLDGHSDADVLIHAAIDALLGAAALGDIGQLYPDRDPQYLGIDSRLLLADTMRRVREAGYEPVNLDATVIAQRPRLAPHIGAIRQSLADAMGIDASAVSVKAKTNEGLDAVGRGEAIAAQAIVLLARMPLFFPGGIS